MREAEGAYSKFPEQFDVTQRNCTPRAKPEKLTKII
jgi:hypothetical protein